MLAYELNYPSVLHKEKITESIAIWRGKKWNAAKCAGKKYKAVHYKTLFFFLWLDDVWDIFNVLQFVISGDLVFFVFFLV